MGETRGRPGEAGKVYVPESENGYNQWMRQNQRGYVVNAPRSAASKQSMMWRQADCPHIQPGGGQHFVESGDLKACSRNPGPLAVWACERGKALVYCERCRGRWEAEPR